MRWREGQVVVQCKAVYALAFPLQVWFVDGTVKCFTGGHIPLTLLAAFCLLLCVGAVFTPVIYYCQKEVQS